MPGLSGGMPSSGGAEAESGGQMNAGGASTGGSPNVGPQKIMAIGDSITQSTCWRALLWESLNESSPSGYEFVGSTLNDSACSPSAYDKDSQAYGSSLLTQAISGNFTNPSKTCSPKAASTGNCPALVDFTSAFEEFSPDIALIHYGTNDVWENKSQESIVDGYSQLIDALRVSNPNVQVLLAQIIPLSQSQCSACATSVPALNAAIVSFANTKTTAASSVISVDQFSGFDAQTDTKDGVHPNDAGSAKMAAKWFSALGAL